MISVLHNRKYLIAITLTIVLCIAATTFFIARLLDKRIERISDATGANVYRQKVSVFRYEFSNLLKGQIMASNLYADSGSSIDHRTLDRTLSALLLSDNKVKQAWYAVVNNRDTSFYYISRVGSHYQKSEMPKYLKEWVHFRFNPADTNKIKDKFVSVKDTLHWLTSSHVGVSGKSKLLFGLDINLKVMQKSFYEVDSKGVSYGVIVDESGMCISNPNDSLIGTRLYDMKAKTLMTEVWTDGQARKERVISDYLKLPVIRYYVPYLINEMRWTIVIDIPFFAYEEDVIAIRTYSMYIGLLAIAVILELMILYQRKWQKEFLLRREVEIRQQELSMERQELSLVAERQQKDNALLQLNKLKEKVNPHFLFNSLSSLNALIEQNPDLAKSFVVKLSRVYRYVLESYPNGMVTVAEELRFVNEYFFLLKIRFGEALEPLDLDVSEFHLQQKIPFMSMQTLLENAVKHNMLSKSKPLKIRMKSEGDFIVVSNNLQLRTDVKHSGEQGLSYLQSTYAYFGNQQFRYGVEGAEYKCYLPLLL